MKTIRCFVLALGATLAVGCFAEASAAQRLQNVIRRLAGPEVQTGTNTPQTFRLAGKVVDAEGRPVAGAVVERYESSSGLPFRGVEAEVLKEHITTEAGGLFEFTLSLATSQVIARKPGFAPAWNQYHQYRRPAGDTTDERLVLTTPTTLGGRVVDEADKPVADAEVWVSMAYSERPLGDGETAVSYLSGKPARNFFSTRTTADGTFRIEGFPASASADLAVSKPGKVLREPQRD